MRIYTRTGDKGQTSLFNGVRVDKDDQRINFLGNLDELNAYIGLLQSHLSEDFKEKVLLDKIQSCLFEVGAEIANPKITESHYKDFSELVPVLEKAMDEMDAELAPLKNFILPGGTVPASYAHVCRTVARRCERLCVTLAKSEEINATIKPLLNRLSDYFFMLSRFINKKNGVEDVVWNS